LQRPFWSPALALCDQPIMVRKVHEWETGLIGLHRLREDIWTKALFCVLVVIALLVLNAAFSQSAGASIIGSDEAVSDAPDEVITDATDDVVTEVPDEVVSDSPDDVVAEAPEDAIGTDDAIGDATGVVEQVVDEVVDEVVETVNPNGDEAEESVVVGDAGLEIDIPVLGDEAGPVADLIEEIPVAVEDTSSVLDDVLTSLLPVGVDLVGVLPVPPPEVEVVVAPATVTAAPVEVGGSSLDLREASPASEASQPLSLADAMYGEQLGTELALFRLSNVTSDAATGPGLSPSPGEETVPGLAAYAPLPRPVPVERGPAGPSQGSSTHAGGGHFGAIDPYGFFAAMAALLALCLVGWIRDRSRSGRSIFPSHGGRPG
jgi:hypothetical protein